MPAVILPVKCAGTGAVLNVELVNPYQDDSVAELKRLLESAAGVAVEDQILLIGPPYKPLKRLDPPLVFSSSSARDDEGLTTAAGVAAAYGGGSGSCSTGSMGPGASTTVEVVGARSIYLYSRRTLDAREAPPREAPLEVQCPELPTSPPEPAPAWLASIPSSSSSSAGAGVTSSGSRLAESLQNYERLVSLNLASGRAYVERGRRLLEACVRCLEEQRVQRDAGAVALANLLDHFGAIARDYEGLRARHAAQAGRHQALLQNFNPNLRRLDARPLHPALVEALRESLALHPSTAGSSSTSSHHHHQQQQQSASAFGGDGLGSGSSPGASGRHHLLLGSSASSSSSAAASASSSASIAGSVPGLDCEAVEKVAAHAHAHAHAHAPQAETVTVTLRDCVPLKRVRDWYDECCRSHERLGRWVGEQGDSLAQLRKGVELQRGEVRAVDWLGALARDVEALKAQLHEQEKSVATLEEAHTNALERIRGALSDGGSGAGGASSGSSGAKQYDTCQWLRGLLDRQAGVMASLESVDYDMLAQTRALGDAKTKTGRWLGQHLLAVSRLQGDIQALRSNLVIGEQALRTERRHFVQLEHLERLPEAYEALLLEIVRRRAYARLFELKVKGALDGVARFREGETAARTDFLRRHSAHLMPVMPVFAQLFPTMQDRPPHFQAKALALDEEQRLPALAVGDVPGALQLLGGGGGGAGGDGGQGEGEDEVAAILKGYTACLSKGREGAAEEDGAGAGAGAGGTEIMPGVDAGPSQEELEAKCAAQELAIARLAAQVQALSASRRELEKQLADAPSQAPLLGGRGLASRGGDGEGGRRAAEENDSLRSCLGAILSSVEEARRGLPPPASSSSSSARTKGGEAETKAGDVSSPQQVVNAVDAAVSALVARVRAAEGKALEAEAQRQALDGSGGAVAVGSKPKISFME